MLKGQSNCHIPYTGYHDFSFQFQKLFVKGIIFVFKTKVNFTGVLIFLWSYFTGQSVGEYVFSGHILQDRGFRVQWSYLTGQSRYVFCDHI